MTIGAWFGKPRHLNTRSACQHGRQRARRPSRRCPVPTTLGGCKWPLRSPAAFELVHHLDGASPRTASRGDLRLVGRHLRPCGSRHQEIDSRCKRTGFPPHLVLRLDRWAHWSALRLAKPRVGAASGSNMVWRYKKFKGRNDQEWSEESATEVRSSAPGRWTPEPLKCVPLKLECPSAFPAKPATRAFGA